ncbi:hypothetical protein [Niabella hibiscisoli]|uniref:hypothetical protein n=1 Tax=Niabella hibiscisoli TaxID=1825928 RepID=UPI001F0F71F0|nr:hypothetical protein [Niabella hibiscisoli]MCH5714955.1 hypothetical protein [Niabella hibiscisoli]
MPEMHVKNIKIENSVFQSDIGVDIQEASNITLNNVKVFTKKTDPVIDIINSDNISVKGLDYTKGTDLLIRVAGDRTKSVLVQQTNYSNTKVKAKAELGAGESSVQIK